jgi:predicted neuraminidase
MCVFRVGFMRILPSFDGILRPCPTDPFRIDAYITPPLCPPAATLCKNSSNHCANLEIVHGNLFLSWFSGYREGWEQTGIAFSTLGLSNSFFNAWTLPQVIATTRVRKFSTQNPVPFFDRDTEILYIFPTRQPSKEKMLQDDPVPGQESLGKILVTSTHISSQSSSHSSYNWKSIQTLNNANGTWGRNSILKKLDGSWIFPVYNESLKGLGHSNEISQLFIRQQNGSSSTKILPFSTYWNNNPMKKSNYLVQPSVIRLISLQPKLRVYYRDRRAQFIYTATSEDDGSTWTTPIATSLPNNNAGIHAIRLQSGAVVLIYNNMSGETKGDLRNILTISLSDDYGETFPFTRVLEHHNPSTTITDESRRFGGLGPTACDCYSYPTAIQSEDGFIHIAFTYQRRTIKYTKIKEEWIRKKGLDAPLCQ